LSLEGKNLAYVLLVVGLIVGAAGGYMLKPAEVVEVAGDTVTVVEEKLPLADTEVELGYIVSTDTGLETAEPHLENIVAADINEYAAMLGHDTSFTFLIDSAAGQAAVHLEKVQGFNSIGVSTFIGGGWSSQAMGSLEYVNGNDMLMWSSSSTSPLIALPDDNLYRMCPTDLVQAPAIAEMLWSHGIKAMVLIYRGDAWADGIVNILKPMWEDEYGGVILEEIRYDTAATEFSNYLQVAEEAAVAAIEGDYTEDQVGVEVIAFSESVTMVTQANSYPVIYNLRWFGSDGTAMTTQFLDDAPDEAVHLMIYSTLASPASSEKYWTLADRYFDEVGYAYGYYTACTYDIAWILAQAMLEAQSTDAMDIIDLMDPIAYNTWGASGWCRINEDGDRYAGNYDIWGYGLVDGEANFVNYGYFDGVSGQVAWDTAAMGYVPTGP
jgi:branched-chain amino acid transport system substrate-binding protein